MNIKEFLDKYLNIEQIQDLLKKHRLEVSGIKSELINRLVSKLDFDTLVNDVYGYLHEEGMKEICKDHYLSILDLKKELSDLKKDVSDSKKDLWRRRQWAHTHVFPRGGLYAMAIGMFLYIIALCIVHLIPQPIYNGDLIAYTNALKTYADTVKVGGYLSIIGFLIFGFGSIWGLHTVGKTYSR